MITPGTSSAKEEKDNEVFFKKVKSIRVKFMSEFVKRAVELISTALSF